MSTLYLRLPPRAALGQTPHAAALGCAFALTGDRGNSIEQEGAASLSDLADVIARAQHVILILAASDVTLLRVSVPPLSTARMKAALPNLVEDQLITDPADCVVVAGAVLDSLRTVAVVQREWLEMLAKAMTVLGARKVSALPAQLCLPYNTDTGADTVIAAITETETDGSRDVALSLRLGPQEGIGLPVMPGLGSDTASEALQTLRTMVPQAALTLYVPATQVAAYQAAADDGIGIQPDRWARWIAGAQEAEPDLMGGLGGAAGPQFNWSRWRWPLILAGALLLLNISALNLDWWRLKQEANSARAALNRTFQNAYPKESVIVDPLLQMRQKIAAAKHAAGQPAPDDFVPLAAGFAEAWNRAGSGSSVTPPAIAALEYHERALLVRIKTPGEIPLATLRTALAAHNLTLERQGADTLQIRSAR